MAELFSQYTSGTQLSAGTIVGSALGASGLNPIVDRLNSITDTDSKILSAITTTITPIGAIIAWLKSFTNTPALPDGWVECDGSVLSDGDSVYDGETLPDLNGDNRFLRGASTSGGTGGSETMAHTHTGTASGTTGSESSHTHTADGTLSTGNPSGPNVDGAGGGFEASKATHTHDVTGTTSAGSAHSHSFSDSFTTSAASNTENRPPYYNVVWIMRVK